VKTETTRESKAEPAPPPPALLRAELKVDVVTSHSKSSSERRRNSNSVSTLSPRLRARMPSAPSCRQTTVVSQKDAPDTPQVSTAAGGAPPALNLSASDSDDGDKHKMVKHFCIFTILPTFI